MKAGRERNFVSNSTQPSQVPENAYLIGLFGILLVLMVSVGAFVLTNYDHDAEKRRVQDENAFKARAFEEHARRIIRTADTALLFMKNEFGKNRSVTENLIAFAEMTKRDISAVQFAVSSSNGDIRYISVKTKTPLNISEREHFKYLSRNAHDGLFISKPFKIMATNSWTYFLSRRINNPDGSFGGLVSIGLDPYYFENIYENLNLGEGGTALIVGTDHIVRVRIDKVIKTVGDDISTFSPVFKEAALNPIGHFEVVVPLDDTERMASYHVMADYPLIVVVSARKTQAMSGFERRKGLYLLLAASFSTFVAVFCWLLIRAQILMNDKNIKLEEELYERQKAEHALASSEKRFRELARMLPEIVFEMDDERKLTFVNEQAFRAIKISAADIAAGVDVLEVLIPADRERGARAIREALNGGVRREFEFSILNKDDSSSPALIIFNPFIEEQRVAGIRGIIVDLTRIKEAEAKLVQAQKMESLGVLAGGIAHDFNNILQGIYGFLQLIQASGELGEKNRLWLSKAAHGCERSAELIRGLLTFSRKNNLGFKVFDLNAELRYCVAILERTLPQTLRFELELADSPLCIKGDPIQMEHILFNLASNANDATSGQGTIRIFTEKQKVERSDNELSLEPGEWIHVAFTDDGAGVDETALKRIFDPFFTTKEVGKGTGLGLAIVFGLIKDHQGQIFCRSKKGEGTTFDIYLPATDEESTPAQDREATPNAAALGSPATILIVDDDEAILESLSAALNSTGVTVFLARSGEEAIGMYREKAADIDLIILDVGMPGMGGVKCFTELRAINPDSRILICTGHSLPAIPVDTHGRPADAIVGKPYRLHDLMVQIAAFLNKAT